MAYNGNQLAQIASTLSQFGSSECHFTENFYTSPTDTLAAVLGANYIDDGQQRGLVLNSVVWVQTSVGLALCQVSAVEVAGYGVTLVQIGLLPPPVSNTYRVVTTAGAVTVSPTDATIILNKSPSGASSINMPTSASRNGLPLTVKDLTYDSFTNNITFVPSTGETLDGFSAAAAVTNGVALIAIDGAAKTWYPLTSGGWFAR